VNISQQDSQLEAASMEGGVNLKIRKRGIIKWIGFYE